jgi:DNA invertase Pin-like site-specific DNA recombinase
MTTKAKAGSKTRIRAVAAQPQRIGYVRVSTYEQRTDRQLDGVAVDRRFEDKVSGSTTNRPQLQAALAHLRPGDTLVVHSMDRLARNLDDLRRVVRELTARGVRVEFVKEGQLFSGERNPMAELMLNLLGSVAEFERSLLRERQAEGIAKAKLRGVYRGRHPKLTTEQAETLLRKDAEASGRGRAALAREFGLSRQTLYDYLHRAAPAKDATATKAASKASEKVAMKTGTRANGGAQQVRT